jgi:hypothetical protein
MKRKQVKDKMCVKQVQTATFSSTKKEQQEILNGHCT